MKDIVIIGAGVIGCSVARALSRYEADICVIEREEDVCAGTSKANSAIVHAGFDAAPGSNKARFNVSGNRMMDEIARALDVPFKRNGALVVCVDPSQRKGLDELLERGKANGVEGLRIVEQEKKVEELENDEGDAPADESDPGQLIYKGSILTISKDSEIIVFLAVMDTRCPTRNCLSDSRTGLLKNTMSSCSESDVVRYKSITKLFTRLVLLVSKKVTFLIVPSTLKKDSCMLSS